MKQFPFSFEDVAVAASQQVQKLSYFEGGAEMTGSCRFVWHENCEYKPL